jgi:hypothetical protein
MFGMTLGPGHPGDARGGGGHGERDQELARRKVIIRMTLSSMYDVELNV